MWYLISSTNPDLKYVLLVGHEITVGRKDCDILLTTDPTVSRKHASLSLVHPESNLAHPQKSALLTLKDLSKFGTWVNKKRLIGEALVKDGDEIAFGSPKSIFLVVNEPFVITTSCLDQVSKKSTKAVIRAFGGHIVSEWTKACSLLIMNSISVTIKVICALITQKSIVLPGYLEKLLDHYKGNGEKPKPEDYQPHVSETQVNAEEVSFNPNPRRSSVFKGMKFIFLSQKQFKKMNLAVELAEGMPILMEEGSDDNDDRVLVEPGTVVMNCGPEEIKTLTPAGQEWVAHVSKYLKRKKKNFIQDAEIGYAVLFCSTEKHCNPDIDKAWQLFQHIPSQSLSQCPVEHSIPDVLVANTETFPRDKEGPKRLAETKRVVDESVLHPQETKIKTEIDSQTIATPVKRKRDDSKERTEAMAFTPKRIKKEVVTQAKTQERSRSQAFSKQDQGEISPDGNVQRKTDQGEKTKDKNPSPSIGRRTSPRPRSRSPSPSPGRRSSRIQKSSPAREITQTSSDETDTKCFSEKGNSKKTMLPKTTQSKVPKLEVIDVDDDFDFSAQPLRKKTARSHHHSQTISDDEHGVNDASTSSKTNTASKIKSEKHDMISESLASPKSKKISILDDSDEEDIGLWQKGKRKRGRDTETARGNNSDDLMDIPSSKNTTPKRETRKSDDTVDSPISKRKVPKRERLDSNDEDDLFDDIPSRARKPSPPPVGEASGEGVRSVRRKSPYPVISPGKRPTRNIKHEVVEESDDEIIVDQQQRSEEASRGRNHPNTGINAEDIPTGFLTTRIPIKKQAVKRSDFVKEEDVATSVVVTQFVDLVAKKPKASSKSSGRKDIPDGCTEWQGKVVRNFKRFKKTAHAGANYLPRIIGGSDLVAYTSKKGKDMGDWFNEPQNESQYARDQEEQDLFDLDMPAGRKKRSR